MVQISHILDLIHVLTSPSFHCCQRNLVIDFIIRTVSSRNAKSLLHSGIPVFTSQVVTLFVFVVVSQPKYKGSLTVAANTFS